MARPWFSSAIHILCLLFFTFIKAKRCSKRKVDKEKNIRDIVFHSMVVISILDIIIANILFMPTGFAFLLGPLIVITLFRSQQDFFSLVMLNMKDSLYMLICILVWVGYFALFG